MSKKEKKPKSNFDPASKKEAKSSTSEDYEKKYPSWRIHRLAMEHPYGCHELSAEDRQRIWGHLADLERKTWHEILIKAKYYNHNIPIADLTKKAQDRLKELFDPLDFDDLLSLRLSGKERIWGIFSQGVVTLIWWDPEHEVYYSPQKHT